MTMLWSELVPKRVDLGIAWEWEYDETFVHRLQKACREQNLTTYVIHTSRVEEAIESYRNRKIRFGCYLDRGSDTLKEFLPLAKLVVESGARIINDYPAIQRANDKATMHLEFISAGLNVPFSVILSPYHQEPDVVHIPDEKLGRPFIIKPAIGGGGNGVVTDAQTMADVRAARKSESKQKYLLQHKIVPAVLAGRRAWFRAFYVLGDTYLAWWDDQTHVYAYMEPSDERAHYLTPLRDIIRKIANISRLDFFSAEIAFIKEREFVVVDYVNEVCDLRFQSGHADGVPDRLVNEIIGSIVKYVASRNVENSRHASVRLVHQYLAPA